MSRFRPVLKLAWLVAKRNGLPHDLRRHLINTYIKKHLFKWETSELRDERIRQKWDAWENVLSSRTLKRQIERVERWCSHDIDDGRMQMRVVKTHFRGDLWVWHHVLP